MAKRNGIPVQVSIDDSGGTPVDISGDINSFTLSTPRGEEDVTGLDKAAMERLLLLADGDVQLKGTFNAALSHTVFSDVPTTDAVRTVTIVYPPGGAGAPKLEMEMVLLDYAQDRAANGALTWTVPAKLADGVAPVWTTV